MGNLASLPVEPPLTEKNLPNQSGKVFLITGSTSGIGLQLAKILYAADAKVWIVGRSTSKGQKVQASIRASCPQSKGHLELLIVDFNDLKTIQPAIDDFLNRETTLDVLWNNAGIMIPPKGTVTAQGYEAQIGVNALAPHFFTKLLTPILIKTAKARAAGRTRVVWLSSSAAKDFAPPGVSISMRWNARISTRSGRIMAADPGNLDTNLYKDMPRFQHVIAKALALKPPIYGAYTELFAGLSDEIKMGENGAWVVPWGANSTPRKDIDEGRRTGGKIGGGASERFWNWCDDQVKDACGIE